QALLDEMLKKQEAALRKQFEEREKKLIELYEQREKEWSSLFEAQTNVVADHVAKHIGNEVVESYTAKFGEDSEATQHAKSFPYQEQGQVAAQFLKENGQVMTADEIIAKHTTTWDEFNAMGGLTTNQAQTFDPFKDEQPVVAPALDQEVKDIMAAIDYQVQNYSQADNFPIDSTPVVVANDTPTASQEQFVEHAPTVAGPDQVKASIASIRANAAESGSDGQEQSQEDLRAAAIAKFKQNPKLELGKPTTYEQPTEQAEVQESSSITPEMLAATQESSQFMQTADKKATEFKRVLNTMPNADESKRKTISPMDPKLGFDNLIAEMSTEKHKVHGKSNVLVNYFDKTRHFDFGGKTAEEYRASCVEKKDYQGWLNTFQPGLERMKEQHTSEMKLMPFEATDEQIKEMELKHKTEVAFYETSAKMELSKAQKLFPHQFYDDPSGLQSNNRNQNGIALQSSADIPQPPSKKEIRALHDTFRDWKAHTLGERWRTEFEPETTLQQKQKKLGAMLSQAKPTQEAQNREQIMKKVREFKLAY
ncbi:TPA: hypothetical protein ACQVJW_005582, partial [Serratia marcescens]